VKLDHEKPAMGRPLESLVTTVVATSGGASLWEASTQCVIGCSKQGRWLGFDIQSHGGSLVFIGGVYPTHNRGRFLKDLSTNRLQILTNRGRNWKGEELPYA
jgi:hypothetical protein